MRRNKEREPQKVVPETEVSVIGDIQKRIGQRKLKGFRILQNGNAVELAPTDLSLHDLSEIKKKLLSYTLVEFKLNRRRIFQTRGGWLVIPELISVELGLNRVTTEKKKAKEYFVKSQAVQPTVIRRRYIEKKPPANVDAMLAELNLFLHGRQEGE